jgi:hypothetical protein
MAKDYEYLEEIRKESSQRKAELKRDRGTRGQYSQDAIIRKAIDINTKAFIERNGMSEKEARKRAKEVAYNRDKRFK